jgi:tetraacyldisaccharide 4'-kinase
MRSFRILLVPFSWLYALIIRLRHFLYDKGILEVYVPQQKAIVVGNLSLGGTGKTPMVEYLISTLGEENVAILSRGYGRKTKGTLEVLPFMQPSECGDEPLLIKTSHPKTVVVVDENRARGLKFLQRQYPSIDKVILDDAMQHRKIKPHFTFLLTTWERPFFSDYLIPAGNLRDIKSRKKAADAIIFTKTPPHLDKDSIQRLKSRAIDHGQPVYFSSIRYVDLLNEENESVSPAAGSKVVAVTGIANPSEFISHVANHFDIVKHFDYPDHHEFSKGELHSLREFIDTFGPEKPPIITTEKDWQRLAKSKSFFTKRGIRILHWKIEADFGKDKNRIDELIRSI